MCPRCRAVYSAQLERCPGDGERLVDEQRHPLIGQTIDRYKIVEALGQGAMGVVYRATHVVLPREYAIKVLYRDLAANQTLIERFRREAQAVSTMAHPNIVSVADFVTLPNGLTFIVMELVHGRTLEQAIQAEAPFSPARAARITRQIAAGLGEAHRLGFVHRDIKPSNIMLGDAMGGEPVKILDFGVVGLGAAGFETRLTAIGHIIGTPTYMAPEQVHDPQVGPAADLYALGVLLFEMLSGEPPFTGVDRTQVFIKHISEPPPRLPPSGGLEDVAYWLLEKKPARRPKSAEDLIAGIDRLGFGPEKRPARDASQRPTEPRAASLARPRRDEDATEIPSFDVDTFRPEDQLGVEVRSMFDRDTDAISRADVAPSLLAAEPRAGGSKTDARGHGAAPIAPARSEPRGNGAAPSPPTAEPHPFDDTVPRVVVQRSEAQMTPRGGVRSGPSTRETEPSVEARPSARAAAAPRTSASVPARASTSQPARSSARVVDDPFAALGPTPSLPDWPAWDPDGSYDARVPAHEHAETAPMRARSTGRSPGIVDPSSTAAMMRAPDLGLETDRAPVPTERELSDDLVLFEPELPPGQVTDKHRLDDGPTQVDFDAGLSLSGGDQLVIPVTDEVSSPGAQSPETKITDPELASLGTSEVPDEVFDRLDLSTAVDLEAPAIMELEAAGRRLDHAEPGDPTHVDLEDPGATPRLDDALGAHGPAALKALDIPRVDSGVLRALEGVRSQDQTSTVQDFGAHSSRTALEERVPVPSATAPLVSQVASTLPLDAKVPASLEVKRSGPSGGTLFVVLVTGLVLLGFLLVAVWLWSTSGDPIPIPTTTPAVPS
ncbi:protein kinase [Myxococcota bacterium]|nr:protein kinase [Myxococcota bacterium]